MIDINTEKVCVKCGAVKSITEFEMDGKQFRPRCRVCVNARRRELYKSDVNAVYGKRKREKLKQDRERYIRRSMSWRQKGVDKKDRLSYDGYLSLLEKQNNACAICGKPETARSSKGEVKSLAIDHDHMTGKVRGLLCFRCNTSLLVIEDQKLLSTALVYLASHTALS